MRGGFQDSAPEFVEALDQRTEERPRFRSLFFARCLLFFILFFLWLAFSGKFDLFHISLGLISCILVVAFVGDLIPEMRNYGILRSVSGFLLYIPWLLYQILLANIHVIKIVFHPNPKNVIEPQIIRKKTLLRSDLAKITYANSITLTPGTITVSINVYDELVVHAIDSPSLEGIVSGAMEARIRKAFGET